MNNVIYDVREVFYDLVYENRYFLKKKCLFSNKGNSG